MMIFFIRK